MAKSNMKRPAALKKSTAKPAAKSAAMKKSPSTDDEPRKSRVGFKNAGTLAESLSPFVEKRFFTNYTTDRAIKSMDKKLFQGILNSCRQLSPTWNFPDTVIKKALLAILKREDWSYEYFDKQHLAEQIKECDRDAWSTTNSLRVKGKQPDRAAKVEGKPAEQHDLMEEEAAAFVRSDWFLNTLEGMMGGDLGYLSPTPGPPRRRAAETAKQEEASPKTPKQTLLKLKPMDPDEGDDKDDQADKPKPKRAKKSSDAQKKENADAEKKKKEKNPNDTDAEKKEKKPDDADAEKKEKKPDDAVAEKKEKKPDDAEKKKEKKPDDADAEKKEKKHHDADEKKEKKPGDCHKKKEKKPDDADAEHDEKMPDDADKSKEAAGDIKWNPELGKACWQKKEGVIISSVPFVDKDDEVKVSFGGLLWSVPHLVPSDLDSSMPPKNPMQTQTKVKAVPKAKQLKPVDDYIYPIIRCKYCTQGSKNPLIKIEVREDRHNLRSKWVQKLQLVVKDNLSVQKAMHIAKSFADSYVYMNLNPEHGMMSAMDSRETLTAETLVDAPQEAEAPAAAPSPIATASAAPSPMTSESEARAITNYASHYRRDPKDVSIEMVRASAEGATHWATVGLDLTARSPLGQTMNRALKHKPDVKAMYGLMLDQFKGEFRRAWAVQKDFEFVRTVKTTENSFRKKREDLGTYKTELQITQLLGGTDQPAAVEQTQNYIKMCTREDLKEYCVCFNSWLKVDTYLWVEHLISTSNHQEWRSTVSVECTETIPGSWAEKVEISKAIRCFAVENNARLVDVKEDDVRNSELGVAGYAALFDKTPAAAPKAGGDGSNARGGKGKRTTPVEDAGAGLADGEPAAGTNGGEEPKAKKARNGANVLSSKKEKEVKELLAQEQSSDNTMSVLTVQMGKGDASSWAWASGFVKNYKDCRMQVLQLYADNPFFQSMKVAVLSSKELQKVKKDYKDLYVPKLCDFVSMLGPKILAMAEASAQIQLMAEAKQNASESAKATPGPKSKAKSNKGPKRAASQASLASA
ncbi:unnamed protein product [Symbiodinium sp. CCMP2592]|nr:unnamed protein product [Symbiodinium sp. CCMP2592]